MARILISGAAGFIGSHLKEALLGDVWGFDNYLTGSRDRTAIHEMDILDRVALYEYANRIEPEVVIHCAASYDNPDLWHRDTEVNVLGGINATAIAKHHSAHLIYFQTILPPVSSYAISKIAAEQYMRMSGVDLTVLRLGNIYGPRNLSGPIPVFYKRLNENMPCVVVDTTRDMVFIEDLVECVLAVVKERRIGTFDVCSGRQTSILEIFKLVAYAMEVHQQPPVIPPDPDDVQGYVTTSNAVPGWKATTSLAEGIARTVSSYDRSGVSQTHTHLRLKG